MTRFEQLQHCDHLEGRLAALRTSAEAFIQRRYQPDFVMFSGDLWSMPIPEAEPPNEWGRVALASIAAATAITLFAVANALARPW